MIDAQLINELHFEDGHFLNILIFRHSKLKIVLAIPAVNARKIEAKNSAVHKLNSTDMIHFHTFKQEISRS